MLQFVDLYVPGTVHITHNSHDTSTTSKVLIMPNACDLQKPESLFMIPSPQKRMKQPHPMHIQDVSISNNHCTMRMEKEHQICQGASLQPSIGVSLCSMPSHDLCHENEQSPE